MFPFFLIKKWHKSQIAGIVKEAYRHVPMYQIFWNEHGIFPGGLKRFDDFKRFPIITKKIIKAFKIEQQLHNAFPEDQREWRETSGSTGEPFHFAANSLYAKYFPDKRFLASARRRFLIWRGMSPNRILGLRFAQIRCEPYQAPLRQCLFIPISEFNSSPEAVLQKIAIFKPELIESTTTVIEELACCALKTNPTIQLKVAYIETMGERMTKAQRNIIEEAFNCEAFNLYGLDEIGIVATECRFHYGLHIAEESYLVEILDSDGNSLPNGIFGRVVITSFFNDAMPFIKYDTGDEGMIIPKPCACGLNSRLLIVQGRGGEYLTVEGIRYNTIELTNFMDEFSDVVLRYQVMKTAKEEIELRIIPADNFHENDIINISEKWRKKFMITPKIILVNSIIKNSRGKTPVIIEETQSN